MSLALLDFQQAAATKLFENALSYFERGGDKVSGRTIPFVGQLKAVTGAGKTPILASVISRFPNAIVLWTTKFGSVVDQTAVNLDVGGKYHHLLGTGSVEVMRFTEIPSIETWQRILGRADGLTILVSTVAAWYSSEKDERLNVHRVHDDWGDKSRWDQLKADRKRLLWVVYDEAHNTTTEQVELLDDLEPAGFFIATASPVKGLLQQYLSMLREDDRKRRLVSVRTRDVVDAQLLKSTISVADYDSPTEEMIAAAVKRRADLEKRGKSFGMTSPPKAIYVVEASNSTTGAEARPLAIWKTLRNKNGVPASSIAVCTNTRTLPAEAIRVQSLNQLAPEFTHIIFNKKLQEGWDDPAVYVCYFDGKTDSATRIQQVIGRALRQPDARHFADEDLNTAHFFVNCPSNRLEKIVDGLKEELRIYKDADEPDDFEPFVVKEERKALPKIPLRPEWEGKLTVPRLQLELPSPDHLLRILKKRTLGVTDDDRAAPGRALVNIVSVKTGDVQQQTVDLFEDMRVTLGSYLQEQIRLRSKNCLNAINPSAFVNDKLNQTACYRSKALELYKGVAEAIVDEYENHVSLTELADEEHRQYVVGPYQPSGDQKRPFEKSGHPHYDTRAFSNDDEEELAKALDKLDFAWVRNKDRVDYGIPLPIKSGSSSQFFPDFLWWVKNTIWALDPTGKFLLGEKRRTKLLSVPTPLRIALIVHGRLDSAFEKVSEDGWSVVRVRYGNNAPETFENLGELLGVLVSDS